METLVRQFVQMCFDTSNPTSRRDKPISRNMESSDSPTRCANEGVATTRQGHGLVDPNGTAHALARTLHWRDQGISKAGNQKGRTTGIELAWMWLRYQPESDLSVWYRARVGATKGHIRRIAIVALARKLLVALWRYLETGLVPRGAVLKGDQ